MSKSRGSGDWLVLEELLERGDPTFVERLRAFHDAEILASFAARWYGDRRPASRRLLLEYLDRPLDAFVTSRWSSGCSSWPRPRATTRSWHGSLSSSTVPCVARADGDASQRGLVRTKPARAVVAAWEGQGRKASRPGFRAVAAHAFRGRGTSEVVIPRHGVPRPWNYHDPLTGRPIRENATRLDISTSGGRSDRRGTDRRQRLARCALFSVATRHYLRRRSCAISGGWAGRPQRYVKGTPSPSFVRRSGRTDGLALIDNWGLIHVLFHRSRVLLARPAGWAPAEGRSLAELSPRRSSSRSGTAPRAIVGPATAARCRPVRQWAVQMVRRHESARAAIGLEDFFKLVAHDDPDSCSPADGS